MQIKTSAEISKALSLRSRDIGSIASFEKIDIRMFADNHQLSRLDTDDWQIVFGRRGAGKTTLLAIYADYITKNDQNKNASIEIYVPDFLNTVENRGDKKISDADSARIYFNDFMKYVARHLFNVFTTNDDKSKFFRILQKKSEKKKRVEDLILEIEKSTSQPIKTTIGAEIKIRELKEEIFSLINKHSQAAHVDGDFKIQANFDVPPQIRGGLGFSAGNDISESETSKSGLKSQTEYQNFVMEYSKTRALIIELLDVLGFEKLYIFLDEWSELDRTGKTEIQPYFADLIKKVFWKNPRFVFKIGAIRNHTRLDMTKDENHIIGLELAADIFEINLDAVYSESALEEKNAFYEELIFRHLAACNDALLEFQRELSFTKYGTIQSLPLDTFITYIFKTRDVFNELVKGSGNLPRDFVEMFDSISHKKKYLVEPLWTMADSKQAIRNQFLGKQRLLQSVNLDLCGQIAQLVRKNDSRLIIVSSDSEKNTLLGIADLYHRRILHEVPYSEIPSSMRNRYDFYLAHLGMYYDEFQNKYNDISDEAEEISLSDLNLLENAEKYILPLSLN